MFKFNYATVAIFGALCSNAFALNNAPVVEPLAFQFSPTLAESKARAYQGWLNQINKPYASQLGAGNGASVTVGVVDSGVQVNHPSLNGQVLATYNAVTGGSDVTDQLGHGTHVSGIIAGTTAHGGLFEGVAPGAKLVMAKVFTTGGSSSVTIGRGIDWVVNVQKAPILSLSLGTGGPSLQPNIQNAVNKGTLITAALGNDGKSTGSWPAAFAKADWAQGQIIAVGALDAKNQKASFSNYDPTLANWTVFAPGVSVASTYSTPTQQSSYATMSGTSMATPVVAGQAALIKSNWNFLGAADLAQIIFQSATRLCSGTVSADLCASRTTADPMYGWGLINVGASLQPLGTLNVGTKSGAAVSYSASSLTGSTTGMAASLKSVNTLAVDKFNRAFAISLAGNVSGANVAMQATPMAATKTASINGVKFFAEYAPLAAQPQGAAFAGVDTAAGLGRMSYSFSNDKGTSYGFGSGGTTGSFFGLQSTDMTPLSLNGEGNRFNAPYLGLTDSATHLGFGTTFKDGTVLRMGALNQSASNASSLHQLANPVAARSMTMMEMQKTIFNITTVATVGQLQETNSVLGMTGSGALALAATPRTSFVTLAGALPLTQKTTFSAMATLGHTAAYNNTGISLIDGASGSRSTAFSLGLAQKDVLQDGDSIGLTLARPLKVTSGSIQVSTAVAQSQVDGSLQYASQSVNLAPSGNQKDLELSYATPMRAGSQLIALAQVKLQPGHDASAPTQFGIGVRYVFAFK